eukprot:COSAG05_NODE_78_length_21399_cov_26.298216_1_plen_68_part_00
MQRAQLSILSILLVGIYSSSRILATSTAVKRDDEIRDEIGMQSTLTENCMQSRTLLARARALAPCRA